MSEESTYRHEDNRAKAVKVAQETIVSSLSKNKYQSVSNLKADTNLPVDVITSALGNLEVERKLSFDESGVVSVYYLNENKPKDKLIMIGGGFAVRGEEPERKKSANGQFAGFEPIKELACAGLTQREIAERINLSETDFMRVMAIPEVFIAWKEGHECFLKTKSPEPADSGDLSDAQKDEMLEEILEEPEQIGEVKFERGGSVTFYFEDVNFLDLSASDAQAVCQIIKFVAERREKNR